MIDNCSDWGRDFMIIGSRVIFIDAGVIFVLIALTVRLSLPC